MKCLKKNKIAPQAVPNLKELPRQHENKRAWLRTLSERRVHLLDPSPIDIDLNDVALGLSREARWNGQTKGRHLLSVAYHGCTVWRILIQKYPDAEKGLQLAAATHDNPEYLIKDQASPVKDVIGPLAYHELEDRAERANNIAQGLPACLPADWKKKIKWADKKAAATEAFQKAGWSMKEIRCKKEGMGWQGELWDGKIRDISPNRARKEFLNTVNFINGSYKKSLFAGEGKVSYWWLLCFRIWQRREAKKRMKQRPR